MKNLSCLTIGIVVNTTVFRQKCNQPEDQKMVLSAARGCGGTTVDARMTIMDHKNRKKLVWFALGCLFFAAFVTFGVRLSTGVTGAHAGQTAAASLPLLDRESPQTTEIALFAFG